MTEQSLPLGPCKALLLLLRALGGRFRRRRWGHGEGVGTPRQTRRLRRFPSLTRPLPGSTPHPHPKMIGGRERESAPGLRGQCSVGRHAEVSVVAFEEGGGGGAPTCFGSGHVSPDLPRKRPEASAKPSEILPCPPLASFPALPADDGSGRRPACSLHTLRGALFASPGSRAPPLSTRAWFGGGPERPCLPACPPARPPPSPPPRRRWPI